MTDTEGFAMFAWARGVFPNLSQIGTPQMNFWIRTEWTECR